MIEESRIPDYELRNGSECACPTCRRVFASERAFDAHRIGDYASGRLCAADPAGEGLELDNRGRWRIKR